MKALKPTETLKKHFTMLAVAGFYKPYRKFETEFFNKAHRIYIYFTFILTTIYITQHIIFIYDSLYDLSHVIASLTVVLETMAVLYKLLMFNIKSKSVDEVLLILEGPFFKQETEYDTEIQRKINKEINTLLKFAMVALSLAGSSWLLVPVANLALGNHVLIPSYFPFNTDGTVGVTLSALYESILISWLGFGDLTLDCLIAGFYAQIIAQLQMLKHSLSNFVQPGRSENEMRKSLKNIVLKYDQIVFYKERLESIFNSSMLIQLLVSALMFCIVVYRLKTMNIISVDFFNLAQYLFCLQIELFIFCYYGTQVEYESQFVNLSVFGSQWYLLPPSLRRDLVLAMARWMRSITVRIAYVVPLSINTFVGVLRLSYSLYTLLKHT